MKRTQVAALLAGAALGLTGITAAVVLSRKEGRDAARRLIEKGRPVAEQAKVFGEKAARTAVEQYQVVAPKAIETSHTLREQAPHAAEAISAKLPSIGQNGKKEPAEVIA